MNTDICDAIENRKLIELYYDGGTRIVEPHCHGITTAGNEAMRAYQVDGYSTSGNFVGWKMFVLSDASNIRMLDETFNGPRVGYQKGDRGMSQIFCEL